MLLEDVDGAMSAGSGCEHEQRRGVSRFELGVAAFALMGLLSAQWLLSRAIHGANYHGSDGKMAQAITLAALKFAGIFEVTNLSPIMGIGSQMLPKNVWINPSLWPFALVGTELAADLSALVALATFVFACYVMARCFDLPVVPSAVAAQWCIVLFAPVLLLMGTPTNFALTPADAVIYAPYMVGLGLLARLERASWRAVALTTAGILAVLFYSIVGDPLFACVAGTGWMVAYVVTIFGSLRPRIIVIRGAALGTCGAALLLSGVAMYLYATSQYTARVQFAAAVDRPRWMVFVSAVSYSPRMKYFYIAWTVGWLLALVASRGRVRLLAVAAATSFAVYVAYSTVYLLLNAPWVLPIPLYVEQCVIPLYVTAAVGGYWSGLRLAGPLARRLHAALDAHGRGGLVAALTVVALIPAVLTNYALRRATPLAHVYDQPWPNEPEAMRFFEDTIGQRVGEAFRGAVYFYSINPDTADTLSALWARGIASIDEYSQLVSPQALYFARAMFQQDVRGSLNGFVPIPGPSPDKFLSALQMFGARYYVTSDAPALTALRTMAERSGLPTIRLPHRPLGGKPGHWHAYVLPRPNLGDYSPTEVMMTGSATDIMAKITAPGFDFTRQAVVSRAIGGPLVPARNMQLSRGRNRLHVSGDSDGTSLIVLPQQFSHCLRARDGRVHLVRTNLMMTGVLFSGAVDTDILLDFGLFSPSCRLADLADMKRLGLKIDLRMPHLSSGPLWPDWAAAVAMLRAAARGIK